MVYDLVASDASFTRADRVADVAAPAALLALCAVFVLAEKRAPIWQQLNEWPIRVPSAVGVAHRAPLLDSFQPGFAE